MRIEQKLEVIDKKVGENTKSICDHIIKYNQEYKELNEKCQSMKTNVDSHDSAITEMKERITQAEQENLLLRERVYNLEKIARDLNFRHEEARRQNNIVQGIPEANYMKTKQSVTELLSIMGVQVSSATVSNLQRIGKYSEGKRKPRPIKVKFLSSISKQDLYKNIGKLKDVDKWKHVLIGDDLSEIKTNEQKDLRCIAAVAKANGIQAAYKNGALSIDDKKYTYADINSLPHGLSMEMAKIRPTKDGTAYQGHHAYLSNLYECPIMDNGNPFWSSEQHYQCGRAKTAKNQQLYRKLRECKKTYEHIRLSKEIPDPENWNQLRVPQMRRSIYLKYEQNPILRDKLINTKGFLYEATLTDFWGCGMAISQSAEISQDMAKKPNKQGEVTAEYRDLFLKGKVDKFLA